MKKRNNKTLYALFGVGGVLLLWTLLSLVVDSVFLLPTPWDTFYRLFLIVSSREFYYAFFTTALRSIVGFSISCVLAILLSTLSYLKPALYHAFSPIVTILRSTPSMSIILLTFAWFPKEVRPVFIGFLVCFPLLYESFHNTLVGVDKKLVDMSKVYGVSTKNKIKYLYLPLTREGFFSGAKSGISLNLKVVISAEVMVNTVKSLGWYMRVAQLDTAIASLFAWTICALILSFLFEALVSLLTRLTSPKRKIAKITD